MNFLDKTIAHQVPDAILLSAFDEGVEMIGFRVDDRLYVVKAEYDEWPTIKCNLFVPEGELDCWIFLDESGKEYCGEEQPRQWRGTPRTLVSKILSAILLNGKLPRKLPWLAAIDEMNIELGYYATELEAALAYDRAAILIYGDAADTNFAPKQSEHVVLPDGVMRQIKALKAGGGML